MDLKEGEPGTKGRTSAGAPVGSIGESHPTSHNKKLQRKDI